MDSDVSKSATLYDLLGWLDKNRKQAAWVAGIIFVVAVIVAFFISRANEREIEASEELSALRSSQTASGSPSPVSSQEYLKLAEKYPKTGAGARALLTGAGASFTEGRFDQAYSLFDKFLREYPGNPLSPQALLGVAASLDAQGKITEATTRYKELTTRYPNDPTGRQAKSALARLYEVQDKPLEAVKLYQELMRTEAYNSIGAEAAVRLEELQLKYPGLTQTNAPMTKTN